MASLKFWGVEVKPGQTVSCDPGKERFILVSQAALGEAKKGSANIVVSAKIDDNKVIVGTLSAENCPQFHCDLSFHKEFELSHSSKASSVFVCGYKIVMPDKDEGEVRTVNNQVIEDDSDSSSLDDLSSSDDELTEDESSSEEDDSSSEDIDTSSEEDDSSSEEIDTSSEEDSSDEEGKNTPMKPEDGKKRVAETALKTSAFDKKAKTATPTCQTMGDDKKVPRVATPHPAKQASKAPGNGNSKPKAKSPKSVGTHACKSCSRTFGSDSALQSHEKAKHA